MKTTGDAKPMRWLAIAAGVATALGGSAPMWSLDWPDRLIATAAGARLLEGDLSLYVHMPEAQMGPLALVVAGILPTPVYVVVVCALLGLLLQLVFLAFPDRPVTLWHVGGAVLLGYPWHRFAVTAHADDALVLIGLALMLVARRRGLPWLVALGFVVAIAAKPTAVLFLPLLFLLGSRRAVAWGVLGSVAVWAPFVLADVRGFLAAGEGIVSVAPGSLPALLGSDVGAVFPAWVRPVQLLGGLALCWAVGRKSPVGAILAVLAYRTALEPGAFPAYCTSIIAAGLLLDVARHRLPAATVAAFVAWMVSFDYSMSDDRGALRLLLLGAILALAVRGQGGGMSVPGSATTTLDPNSAAMVSHRPRM